MYLMYSVIKKVLTQYLAQTYFSFLSHCVAIKKYFLLFHGQIKEIQTI